MSVRDVTSNTTGTRPDVPDLGRATLRLDGVTVNYDGFNKHRTVIGDGVRIGSDTMLVAPVELGDDSVTGAGSVITKDVPDGALAVERTEQRTVENYRERTDAEYRRRGGRKRKA